MRPADELFAIIERYGIIGPEGFLTLESLPAKQLDRLYHETFHALYEAQLESLQHQSIRSTGPLSFHANASIRGDSGCSSSAFSSRLVKPSFSAFRDWSLAPIPAMPFWSLQFFAKKFHPRG
jgi:hypothetical protein